MDGQFYLDSRAPFLTGDIGTVTLATTDKALYPVSNFPVLGGQYFNFIGKKMRIELSGRITTPASPSGNLTFDIYYGNGADTNGTILASSAAVALTTSQTNLSWYMQANITCRTVGSGGTLFVMGFALFNEAVIASKMMIPASAPAASGGVDLTAANIISIQAKASTGSTTMQIHDMTVIAVN